MITNFNSADVSLYNIVFVNGVFPLVQLQKNGHVHCLCSRSQDHMFRARGNMFPGYKEYEPALSKTKVNCPCGNVVIESLDVESQVTLSHKVSSLESRVSSL